MSLYELNPVDRLTVGTLGTPGNRTFYLQGVIESEDFTVIIEKEQAKALAMAIEQMLEQLEERYELPPLRPNRISAKELEFQPPSKERFRVGQLGLMYDESSGMVLMIAQQLVEESVQPSDVVRYYVTRDQLAALARHIPQVLEGGRPLCPLCNQPMGAQGQHFCPRSNGHLSH